LDNVQLCWEIQAGIAPLQSIEYSVGTAPGLTDIRDWTDTGSSEPTACHEIAGLPAACNAPVYINIRATSETGMQSDEEPTDGVIIVASGQDPDDDGFTNEVEIEAGSDPCNIYSIPKDTTITLKTGFNMIAIPAEVMFMPDLRDWLPLLGTADDIETVMVYDPANHRFITLVPEASSNPSFPLSGGEALIVYAKRAFDISFTSALCGPMDLRQGLNVFGFACPPDGYSAFDLLSALGAENVNSIQRFDTDSGTFETTGFEGSLHPYGVDFAIVVGEGYLVFMK
jgi:hypothetical protein